MATIDRPAIPTRRRFLKIIAGIAGLSLIDTPAGAAFTEPVRWRGTALGSFTEVTVFHPDRRKAEELVKLTVAEVRRLEGMFSLFRDSSELLVLNRTGILETPSPEFIELLSLARQYHDLSGGMFDPSVQPLWTLYEEHFRHRNAAATDGPDRRVLDNALQRIGMDHVIFNRDRVVFQVPRMSLTFNGIAQGFITDKAVEFLRRQGMNHSLVDFGEVGSIGGRPDGTPWQVGVTDPDGGKAAKFTIPVNNMAVATSGGYGFRFSSDARFNHIFDPHNGLCSRRYASVSIIHPSAAAADAMATAACLMTEDEISGMLAAAGGEAWLIDNNGEVKSLRSA